MSDFEETYWRDAIAEMRAYATKDDCQHCNMGYDGHAREGDCLFSPGTQFLSKGNSYDIKTFRKKILYDFSDVAGDFAASRKKP